MKKKIISLCLVVALGATAVIGGTLAYFTDTTQEQTNAFTVGNVTITLDETDIANGNTDTKIRTEANQTFEDAIVPAREFVKDPTIHILEKSEDCYAFLEIDLNKYVSLINLMGVDAYNADEEFPELTGDYPGLGLFVKNVLEDADLRARVVNRWFVGVDHADWKIMNLNDIKAMVPSFAAGKNPDELCIKLGYIGEKSDKGVISPNGEQVDLKFMDKFTMPATVTEEMFNGTLAYRIDGVSASNFNTDSANFKLSFTAHAIQAAELETIEAAYAAYFAQNK